MIMAHNMGGVFVQEYSFILHLATLGNLGFKTFSFFKTFELHRSYIYNLVQCAVVWFGVEGSKSNTISQSPVTEVGPEQSSEIR